jgi:hypothetical protein
MTIVAEIRHRVEGPHKQTPPQASPPVNWSSVALDTDTLGEKAKLSDETVRRKVPQRDKRDRYFLKGPLYFGWVRQNIPDPASRLILMAQAFMDMDGSRECVLSAKVWDCAWVVGKDARRRALRKIQKLVVGFEVVNRPGRPSILRRVGF